MLFSCGTSDEPPAQVDVITEQVTFDGDSLLPASIETYKLVLEGEKKVVAGDDLPAYLGDSTSAFLTYSVVGLATAKYSVNERPVEVEIAQFDTPENAYGYYALSRPHGIDRRDIGTESYVLGNNMYCVSDRYVVTLTAASDSTKALSAVSLLAQEIASGIRKTPRPQFFVLYPMRYQIVPSNQYFPSDYRGIEGIDSVYTISYLINGDTAVFFMTVDAAGDQYLKLRKAAEALGPITAAPDTIPYYQATGFAFEHPEHGTIVAGLVRSKLAGVIGYVPENYELLVSRWILGLR
jgi:hypothetical protein